MVYLERKPEGPLGLLVQTLWYCSAPHLPPARQRVLPNGNLQILINLASDTIREFHDDSAESVFTVPATVLSGLQTRYEWVDTRDLQELVGVIFLPGGAAPFFRENATHFRSRTLDLQDLLPLHDVRGHVQEASLPQGKLAALERWMCSQMPADTPGRVPAAVRAVSLLRSHSVRETAEILHCSERHLHTLMTTEVGLSPKAWNRLQRFQRAVQSLHRGSEVPWERFALQCGFYDQSHFSNEFKAFAGIDPRTYAQPSRPWASHIDEA